MSLNRWKTNKPSTKPQPIAKPERLTGGGEPSSIAKVATIAIAAGVIPEIFGEITTNDTPPDDTNSEPVREWLQRKAFYQTLVRCQHCERLSIEGYCCTVAVYPMVNALRACESYTPLQSQRAPIDTMPLSTDRLIEELAERANALLLHLIGCVACCFQDRRYCPEGYITGNAYEVILMAFDDAPSRRDKLLTAMIKARRRIANSRYR